MEEKMESGNITLKEQRRKSAKPLLWISIAGMMMMFAGLTSGYIVSRSSRMIEGDWLVFQLPRIFYASTITVIIISVALHFAVKNIKENKTKTATNLLLAALLLGVAFVVFQFIGWKELKDSGIFFTGPGSNTAGSWVYVITLFHVLHLLAGIVVLIVTYFKAVNKRYSNEDYLGIDLCATYWHFVDVLWVFLFMFLSFIR
jgi:cytochrome c oxidase subunit 3